MPQDPQGEREDDTTQDELIGKVLDHRYKIISIIGEGGVGVVYRAEHIKLGREVAVKVLQREYADKMQLRLRFEREARVMAALTHPNIVHVTDFGVWTGLPFLVMELIEGPTLKELITAGPLRPELVVSLSKQLLKAAAFAHGQGLAHRDLKPSNVILRDQPEGAVSIAILDFGFAKFVTGDPKRGGPQLTSTGMVFGTPAYMAPEQAAGQPAGEHADLYSIGVMIFEMISGRRPFEGDTSELIHHHLLTTPPLLSECCEHIKVPKVVNEFFVRALAKKSTDRFQSAEEMLATLEPLLDAGASSGPEPLPPSSDETAKTLLASPDEITLNEINEQKSDAVTSKPPIPLIERLSTLAKSVRTNRKLMITSIVSGSLFLVVFILPMTLCVVCESGVSPPTDSDETSAQGSDDSSRGGAPGGDSEATTSSEGSQAQDQGPWDLPNEPAFLTEAHNALDAGQRLSEGQVRRLRGFAMSNREDPRPLLLLARYRLGRGNLTDAIDRYERAYNADSQARSDSHMLADLVALAKSRTVGHRAALAVQRIYGADALEEVDRALAEPNLPQDAARRLHQLRAQLAQ